MSEIIVPKDLAKEREKRKRNESYQQALTKVMDQFKVDAMKFANDTKCSMEEAMIYTLQGRVFNLLVNQDALIDVLRNKKVL